MTHSVPNLHEAQTVIVGVDTHKHMHVAVAIDNRGLRLGAHSFGADSEGYRSRQHGQHAGLASDSIGAHRGWRFLSLHAGSAVAGRPPRQSGACGLIAV